MSIKKPGMAELYANGITRMVDVTAEKFGMRQFTAAQDQMRGITDIRKVLNPNQEALAAIGFPGVARIDRSTVLEELTRAFGPNLAKSLTPKPTLSELLAQSFPKFPKPPLSELLGAFARDLINPYDRLGLASLPSLPRLSFDVLACSDGPAAAMLTGASASRDDDKGQAVWLREPVTDSRAIEVVDEIVCAVCEQVVLPIGEELYEVTTGKRRRQVAPVCVGCWTEEQRKPGSLDLAMRWALRTRVIRFTVDGEQDGDKIPRGRLSLVPPSDDDETTA